ncbi:hypothetical protein [Bacillus sp. NPDC094106]|uniref:hypothetical protein n=1 Tax=Bacillus sp. NPDC094106 TaxID=3363949 RepID=UPI0037FF0F80
MKYNELNIGNEAVSKVAYIWGLFESQLAEKYTEDLDVGYRYWIEIAVDWANQVDIQSHEELGYVSRYAERVILEKYGK